MLPDHRARAAACGGHRDSCNRVLGYPGGGEHARCTQMETSPVRQDIPGAIEVTMPGSCYSFFTLQTMCDSSVSEPISHARCTWPRPPASVNAAYRGPTVLPPADPSPSLRDQPLLPRLPAPAAALTINVSTTTRPITPPSHPTSPAPPSCRPP